MKRSMNVVKQERFARIVKNGVQDSLPAMGIQMCIYDWRFYLRISKRFI